MSAEKRWTDVRLLSFDLQTVEFAYMEDYSVSITCTDQLASGGGTYDLRFSRATEEANAMDVDTDDVETILAQYNPHEEVESYMRNILRSASLSVSLTRVVAMLRDTLPIVAELERIRVVAAKAAENIDTFAKTAGWYRVLYGDYRYCFHVSLYPLALLIDIGIVGMPWTSDDRRSSRLQREGRGLLEGRRGWTLQRSPYL